VSVRSTPRILAAVLIAVALLVGVSMPVPYVVLRPGPVFDVLGSVGGVPVISITGAKTHPTTGIMDMLTVTEAGGPVGRISLPGALLSWVDHDDAVVPTDLLYPPGSSAASVNAQSTQEMLQSQDAAAYAALSYLHLPVTLTVVVVGINAGSPALGHLQVGDTILAVDAVPVTTPAQVAAQVSSHEPGQVVRMTVRRGSATHVESIVAGSRNGKAFLDITTGPGYASPIKITIQLNDVGGPSAGLMFTLGIIDKLTQGTLAKGKHIAGTGTMDQDGNVGAIGGVRQKMAAARANGATIFLVPADDCAEALLQVPPGLRLVKVSTLTQAVTELSDAVAGRTTPTCR
jgi:Lon-like protease